MGFLDTQSSTNQVEAIYIAYFDRAADGPGQIYWTSQWATWLPLYGSLGTPDQVAQSFSLQAEAKANYAFLATPPAVLDPANPTQIAGVDSFIESVYQDLFNRAADSTGLLYWQNQILKGLVTVGAAVYDIGNGALGTDQTTLANKITAAVYFTTQTVAANLGETVPLAADFLAAAQTAVNSVTSDGSTVAASEAATNAFINPPPVTATFTMTVGVDNINAGSNSVVNGFVNSTNNNSTFQTGDTVIGGANSTVNINDIDTPAGGPIEAILTNVTTINHTLTASETYDESLYTGVGAEWIKSDTTAAGGNTLTINNAQAGTVYGIATAKSDNLTLNYLTTGTAAKVAVANDDPSTITMTNATSVMVATSGTNVFAFIGGTGITSFTVTGTGANTIDLTGANAVNVGGLTVDTSGDKGVNSIDLATNWAPKDTFVGNANTTIGITVTPTSQFFATGSWGGVSGVQLDPGSNGQVFFTNAAGINTVIDRTDNSATAADNNVVLNGVSGVSSLIFKGDGTTGNQTFGTLWLNPDNTPVLNITFSNAKPLAVFSDVRIGEFGRGGDGIVADGAVAVTLDTSGIMAKGEQGDFTLGGGFTDNALQSFTFISPNAENNWLDYISTRETATLLNFDASAATGNLTVRFKDGDFHNGATLTGAASIKGGDVNTQQSNAGFGTNHITVFDDDTFQNQPVTVFVYLGNGGRATNVNLWDIAALTFAPQYELKSDEYYPWQIFNGTDSDYNYNITAGSGDNLIFTGLGSDIISLGGGVNIVNVSGQNEDINGGIQTISFAAHPEGNDTVLIKGSHASTVNINGMGDEDRVFVLENTHDATDFGTTVTFMAGMHTAGTIIDAVEADPGSLLTLNGLIGGGSDGDTLNVWTGAFDSHHGIHQYALNYAAGAAPITVNIGDSILDHVDVWDHIDIFTSNGGETFNINDVDHFMTVILNRPAVGAVADVVNVNDTNLNLWGVIGTDVINVDPDSSVLISDLNPTASVLAHGPDWDPSSDESAANHTASLNITAHVNITAGDNSIFSSDNLNISEATLLGNHTETVYTDGTYHFDASNHTRYFWSNGDYDLAGNQLVTISPHSVGQVNDVQVANGDHSSTDFVIITGLQSDDLVSFIGHDNFNVNTPGTPNPPGPLVQPTGLITNVAGPPSGSEKTLDPAFAASTTLGTFQAFVNAQNDDNVYWTVIGTNVFIGTSDHHGHDTLVELTGTAVIPTLAVGHNVILGS